MERQQPQRLRPPPRERFAEDLTTLDLARVFDALDTEPHPSVDGHRQITLFKHGTFTLMALSFDAGATWPRHITDGVITLELLKGRLNIFSNEGRHTLLHPGMSIIQPQVALSMHAPEDAHVLMSVILAPDA
ncbi:hypothetical protein DL240_11190 [Lujinxingia litoralis]|uniref:AraC-type arabinose-binding/dimerisation domain-containing protein n=1 Tax=Lujinxingia litoralis TaxID=2211119 RepID=A0A328C904_9DELT|nr:hypothetical protein [Lujinxingia litoralis]RAL22405.1 hypothetical protein DL240_11190 [Lujinxingia litoralis]